MYGNSIDIKKISSTEKEFGLTMTLFAGNSILDPFSKCDGFNVFIGDKDHDFSTGTFLTKLFFFSGQ